MASNTDLRSAVDPTQLSPFFEFVESIESLPIASLLCPFCLNPALLPVLHLPSAPKQCKAMICLRCKQSAEAASKPCPLWLSDQLRHLTPKSVPCSLKTVQHDELIFKKLLHRECCEYCILIGSVGPVCHEPLRSAEIGVPESYQVQQLEKMRVKCTCCKAIVFKYFPFTQITHLISSPNRREFDSHVNNMKCKILCPHGCKRKVMFTEWAEHESDCPDKPVDCTASDQFESSPFSTVVLTLAQCRRRVSSPRLTPRNEAPRMCLPGLASLTQGLFPAIGRN